MTSNEEKTAAPAHIFQLSSIDQGSERVYTRCGLCFACDDDNRENIEMQLSNTVKNTVMRMPILAGSVRPSTATGGGQNGRLEVVVTLANVEDFVSTVKVLSKTEFECTFDELEEKGMPPALFINPHLTPLPDIPERERSPVSAIQANFITGGVIVIIYLHRSVADTIGLRAILDGLSENIYVHQLSDNRLRMESLEQNRLRDRLSGSRGARAGSQSDEGSEDGTITDKLESNLSLAPPQTVCRMLCFSLDLITQSKATVNERLHDIQDDQSVDIWPFDFLLAVLWKGILRAKTQSMPAADIYDKISSLFTPVDIREHIEPVLDMFYFGNAVVHAKATSSITLLTPTLDVGPIAHAAKVISLSGRELDERKIRSTIATINDRANVQSGEVKSKAGALDMVVDSWADVELEHAHLSLGLGSPGWIRQVGRSVAPFTCLIHPSQKIEDQVEVMVQLPEKVLEALKMDDSFMAFVDKIV